MISKIEVSEKLEGQKWNNQSDHLIKDKQERKRGRNSLVKVYIYNFLI